MDGPSSAGTGGQPVYRPGAVVLVATAWLTAGVWLVSGLCDAGPGPAPLPGESAARGVARETTGARRRPPAFVTCERSRLTSFTGRVVMLSRGDAATSLTVQTDWDTTETFVVRHPGPGHLTGLFLRGKPFTRDEWSLVLEDGVPRDGLRATVWVCQDEDDPKVDWEPPPVP